MKIMKILATGNLNPILKSFALAATNKTLLISLFFSSNDIKVFSGQSILSLKNCFALPFEQMPAVDMI